MPVAALLRLRRTITLSGTCVIRLAIRLAETIQFFRNQVTVFVNVHPLELYLRIGQEFIAADDAGMIRIHPVKPA